MSTKHEFPTPPEAPAKTGATITFDQFDALYRAHLGDHDHPSCYVAYVRAEAEVEERHGARRWKNYETFVATRTRYARQSDTAKNTQNNPGKVPVKCQICDTELFHVPRGDLRTIIPHICDACRDEIRKLIFV